VLATAARVFFISVTVFLVAFYIILSYLALRRNRARRYSANPRTVSVIIPAYNEEGVVDNLLNDLRNSSFPIAETIVIDDHSTDSTYETAKRMNVTAIRNEAKLGKAANLNKSAKIAKGEVLVIFDADNRPENHCVKHLLRHFDSEDVGIVTGVTRILSDGFVSKLAALEFSLCFYLFQPFSARFNFFPILHGAYFGIRRELVSFNEDSIAEDFDISVSMACKGHGVEFEPEAVSYVSPPPSLSLFARQRERWIRGAVQTCRRHKGFSKKVFPRIGFLGLFFTALGYLLPLVWAATFTMLIICYVLGEFLLMDGALLAVTVYTVIVVLANSRGGNETKDVLFLPLLGYFYLFFVVWSFVKAVVLEYFGVRAQFDKIPHR